MKETENGSALLPTDPFDQMLSRLTGLPNGAHTNAAAVQAMDFYGKTTAFMVQTVRTEGGDTVFVTQVNAAGSARFIIPPEVVAVIDRQRESCLRQVRRRHGQRLAEAGTLRPGGFTPEMRAKAAVTRKARAAARQKRRAARRG